MKKPFRSSCPVASSLDLMGDKWTLLIIRDLLMGKKTYNEFIDSPEKIPTNILADRLKKMEKEKLISKQLYQTNPKRYQYQLTQCGQDLKYVIKALVKWGNEYIPNTWTPIEIKKKIIK